MAEITVSAFDSPRSHERFEKDFIYATETDARGAIQTAVDSLPPAGGTVRFRSGTYLLSQNGTNTYCLRFDLAATKHLRLEFEPGAVLKIADSVYASADELHMIEIVGVNSESSLTIWGQGILDGNFAGNAREGQPPASGIGTELHKGIEFTDVLLTHVIIGGGLTFRNIDGQALRINGNNNVTKHVIVDGIMIQDCGEGLFIQRCFKSVVNNVVVDNMDKQDGIEIKVCDHIAVSNCIVSKTNDDCLDLVAKGGAWSTISVTGCVFGPRLDSGTGTDREIVCINNGSSDSTLDNITFVGNTIIMNGTDTLNGIVIGPVQDGDAGAITRYILIGNNLIDGTGSASTANGILVDGIADEVSIIGNIIKDCEGNGIDLSDGPDDVLVEGNTLRDNGTGIKYGAGARNIFRGNRGQIFDSLDDTNASHTGDTNNTTLKSITVPAHLLKTGRSIRVHAYGRRESGSGTFAFRFLYDTTGVAALSGLDGDTWVLDGAIVYLGDTSQRGFITVGSGDASALGTVAHGSGTGAEDSTTALTLALQVQLTTGTDTVGCDWIEWRLIN